MSLTVAELGEWAAYVPEPVPAAAPAAALFCRRVADGVDWYDFARAKNPDGTYVNFAAAAVKMTVMNIPARGWSVQAVTADHERLFPQGCLLLQVTGITDANPQAAYGGMVYDRTAQTFSAAPAPVPRSVSAMQAKVALSRAGLLTQVQTWINGQDAETQLIWNSAPTFSRNSTLLANAAAALGLTSAQVDALFATAAGIAP